MIIRYINFLCAGKIDSEQNSIYNTVGAKEIFTPYKSREHIYKLKEVLMKLWVLIYAEYFQKFVESMPNILHNVIKPKAT